MASFFSASLLLALVRQLYFTFVMLIRMVQDKIPQNTTFLMPSDRMLSTTSVPENQVLDLLLRHSIPALLMFNDLIKLPNGTILPTHHTSQMITITNREHQKLYFNNIELTSPDVCHGGDLFRCHGIDGVIRPTATRRRKGSACPPLAAPTTAAPEPASAANQSSEMSSLTSPSVGSATSPALEPAESPQKLDSSASQHRLSYGGSTTLVIGLLLFIF
ncbi:hypothetical protein ACQ4PT_001264 [Festuca glaucescens]